MKPTPPNASTDAKADALGGAMIPVPPSVRDAGKLPEAPAQPALDADELKKQFNAQRIGRVPREGGPDTVTANPPSSRQAAPANPFALDKTKGLIRAQLAEISRGLGNLVAALNGVSALQAQLAGLDTLEGSAEIAKFEGFDSVKAAAFLSELAAARKNLLGE